MKILYINANNKLFLLMNHAFWFYIIARQQMLENEKKNNISKCGINKPEFNAYETSFSSRIRKLFGFGF